MIGALCRFLLLINNNSLRNISLTTLTAKAEGLYTVTSPKPEEAKMNEHQDN